MANTGFKIFHSSNGENFRDAHGRPIFLLATDFSKKHNAICLQTWVAREGNMNDTDNILNLLIDPVSGDIRHATSSRSVCCGYPTELLKKMNIEQLFLQPLDSIVEKISRSEYLKVISLPLNMASGETASARVYASFMTIEQQPMLFLCVFELTPPQDDLLPMQESKPPYICQPASV